MITHSMGVVAGMADRVQVMYAGHIVETASTEEIFANPRHPYTVGLMKSIPRLDATTKEKLEPIRGLPPDLIDLPDMCPFVPRCNYAREKCEQKNPPLLEVGAATGRPAGSGMKSQRARRPPPRRGEMSDGRSSRHPSNEHARLGSLLRSQQPGHALPADAGNHLSAQSRRRPGSRRHFIRGQARARRSVSSASPAAASPPPAAPSCSSTSRPAARSSSRARI